MKKELIKFTSITHDPLEDLGFGLPICFGNPLIIPSFGLKVGIKTEQCRGELKLFKREMTWLHKNQATYKTIETNGKPELVLVKPEHPQWKRRQHHLMLNWVNGRKELLDEFHPDPPKPPHRKRAWLRTNKKMLAYLFVNNETACECDGPLYA